MSEIKHTPGPWEISAKLGTPSVVKGGVTRQYVNGTNQDQLFMVCSVQDDNGGAAAQIANARLIAAAPDLLEALEDARTYIEAVVFNSGPGKKQNNYMACLNRIDAAIDKSKGS